MKWIVSSLMTSFIEVAKNVTKAHWMFSPKFSTMLNDQFKAYNSVMDIDNLVSNTSVWYSGSIQPMYNYFNLFNIFEFLRWF